MQKQHQQLNAAQPTHRQAGKHTNSLTRKLYKQILSVCVCMHHAANARQRKREQPGSS